MPHIRAVIPQEATGATAELFAAITQKIGGVPNIYRTVGQSPAALKGILGLSGALAEGELSAALGEQIALACAGANGCDYCASAHTLLGKNAGLSAEETQRNLQGHASDPQAAVVLAFVRRAVRERALLDNATELGRLRDAGLTEAQVVEVIAHIALNLFTNYFNHLAGTEIDFPVVNSRLAVAA